MELPVNPNLPFARANLYWLNERAIVLEIADDPSRHDHTLVCQQFIWQLANSLRAGVKTVSKIANYMCSAKKAIAILDVVSGNQNLTIIFASSSMDDHAVLELILPYWLQTAHAQATAKPFASSSKCIEIPVNYGGEFGPDLSFVAKAHQLTEYEVIQRHSEALYTVLFLGFQPGFAYLHGLPDSLATPRRKTPRLQISAGSVGIGGRQTGIYPQASPGGWQIIGRMADNAKALFDIKREEPCLLSPAVQLRFVPD